MVTSMKIRLVLGLLLILGVGDIVSAQRYDYSKPQAPGRWVLLGQSRVDGRADHDRIYVGQGRGRFNRVQIRVDNAPIEFNRVIVHYANGRSEEVNIRRRIPAGGQTRAIDLRGNDRNIDSVEFFYSRGGWNTARRPRVLLYGV
jgi:hypothetical protein